MINSETKLTRPTLRSTMIVLLLQSMLVGFALFDHQILTTETYLRMLGLVGLLSFIFHMYGWYKLTNEIFTPYTVFFLVLIMFSYGQSIGWALGLNMGVQDLWSRTEGGLNRRILLQGESFTLLGITLFHLGATIVKIYRKPYRRYQSETVISVFKKLGLVMLIVVVPAFGYTSFQVFRSVLTGGYAAFYELARSRSIIEKLAEIVSRYTQPCLLLLLIAYRERKSVRRLVLTIMLLGISLTLYTGGRSGAVMDFIGIVLAYHFFISPIRTRHTLVGGAIAYISVVVLNMIADVRRMSGRSFAAMFHSMNWSPAHVVGEFVGELGFSLSSIGWTMALVPSAHDFRYGLSYLFALTAPIPNLGFWAVHPVAIWSNLSDWLQKALGRSSGLGYTMFAEAYFNFGWAGVLIPLLYGGVLCILLASVSRMNTEENVLGATFQILIVMTIMKSLIRSSLSSSMRDIVWVLLPLYIVLRVTIGMSHRRN